MTSWPYAQLADVVADDKGLIQTGPFGSQLHSADYVDGDGVPVVMPKDMVGGRIDHSSTARTSMRKAEAMSRHACVPFDILLSRRGEIGRCALVRRADVGVLCGTGSIRISVHRSELDPTFLFYYLSSEHGRHELEEHVVGATMANLSASAVARVRVPCPPLPSQRKVAAILSAFDDLIENNNRRIKILEEMAQRIYREWFVHFRYPGHEGVPLVDSELGAIPQDFALRRLGDVASDIREAADPRNVPAEMPYIGLEHIPRQSWALAEWATAADATSTKLRFSEGDILFGKIRPYFHKVAPAPIAGITSTDTIVIRPNAPAFYGLVLALTSSVAFVDFASQTSQGTKMPRADWKVLRDRRVPVPALPLLASFNDFVGESVSLIRALILSNRSLRAIRDLTLPRLISGEIDADHLDIPVDEAAS